MEAQRAAKTHRGLKTQELGSSNDVKELSLSCNVMYPVMSDLSRKKFNLFSTLVAGLEPATQRLTASCSAN